MVDTDSTSASLQLKKANKTKLSTHVGENTKRFFATIKGGAGIGDGIAEEISIINERLPALDKI